MAAPVAGFSKVVNYLTVVFTDLSTNTPTSWNWDFGDGSPVSNTQNPTHIYTLPGSYTITLTVTNADGSDQEIQFITIGVPVALFRFTPAGLAVNFQDTSSNTPTSWTWNFGDGSPSNTTQNPSHTYASAGLYTVTLQVANAGGSSTYTRNINIAEGPVLPLSLSDFIDSLLPRGLSYDLELKDSLIVKWQIYISVLVDPVVQPADVLTETAYSPLANVLIASLVAYDILVGEVQKAYTLMVTGSGQSSSNQSTGSGSTATTSSGGIKKVVTGPSEVEFHDVTQAYSNYFKGGLSSSNGSSISGIGPLGAFQAQICMLASRLRVYLPMCPREQAPIFVPQILRKSQYHPFETRPTFSQLGLNFGINGEILLY